MAEPKQSTGGEAAKPVTPARPRIVVPPNLEAVYSNVVRISHSPSELVFDFGNILPGESEVHIKARVMMSPLSAKLLQKALADNLTKFETVFGEIKLPPGKSLADDLFRSLQPPEPPKPEGQG
ncbi:MAG: DUF3467 domain-containing protein [Chloroflexi bacterium]|nr:DUF3467 domain-containing protein [Chloroflexota bacterium]